MQLIKTFKLYVNSRHKEDLKAIIFYIGSIICCNCCFYFITNATLGEYIFANTWFGFWVLAYAIKFHFKL